MRYTTYSLLRMVFFLVIATLSPKKGNCTGYEIVFTNSSENAFCIDILIGPENTKCLDGKAVYLYSTRMVKSIVSNGEELYPYKREGKIEVQEVRNDNCETVFEFITGPLLLEKDKYSSFILGKMLEEGICVKQDVAQARNYYRKAGRFGKKDYQRLLNLSRVAVDEEFARSLQDDANRKRERKEEWERKCQNECMLEQDVSTKFRYSKECYNDCMRYMPTD